MKIIQSAWEEEEFYEEEAPTRLLENDEITVAEEGFMLGWSQAG